MNNYEKVIELELRLREAINYLNTTNTDLDKLDYVEEVLEELWGCTDKAALNYNRNAIYDDGSCQYAAASGSNT